MALFCSCSSRIAHAGFTKVSLLLTQTAASFDKFIKLLPPEPDEYAT